MTALPTTAASNPLPARVLGVLMVALLGACASTPPMPSAEMAVAQASVAHANSSGTSENAPAELQIAIAKLASAQQAVNSKDFERARQLAEQADVDAQVAEMHAQATRSRRAAAESEQAARALREEIARKPAPASPR